LELTVLAYRAVEREENNVSGAASLNNARTYRLFPAAAFSLYSLKIGLYALHAVAVFAALFEFGRRVKSSVKVNEQNLVT
jgi:hypothetical protein